MKQIVKLNHTVGTSHLMVTVCSTLESSNNG